MALDSYREWRVWQSAMEMITAVCSSTNSFPKNEQFRLESQLRRVAVATPASIAERYARGGMREYLDFLSIAQGSLPGLETELELAARPACISHEQHIGLGEFADSVGRRQKRLRNALSDKMDSQVTNSKLPNPHNDINS